MSEGIIVSSDCGDIRYDHCVIVKKEFIGMRWQKRPQRGAGAYDNVLQQGWEITTIGSESGIEERWEDVPYVKL